MRKEGLFLDMGRFQASREEQKIRPCVCGLANNFLKIKLVPQIHGLA